MAVDNFQYHDDEEGYFVAESTFGTAVVPAGTNAFRAMNLECGDDRARQLVGDRRGTRSQMERVEGRIPTQPWRASVIFRPSGTLGVAPDFGDLLKHTYGTESAVASTSVTYSLLKDMSSLHGSLYKKLTDGMEGVYSAVVQNLAISWSSDSLIMYEFSGIAKDYIFAGYSTANGTGSGSTSLIVDDPYRFTKYGIIKIGSDDNSGAGYQITAINYDTSTLTLGTAASWSDEDVITGFLPTASYAGDPVFGVDGSVSLDGGSSTIELIGGNIAIATGVGLHNRGFGTDSASDVILEGRREITGSINMLDRRDETDLVGQFRNKVQKDVRIILGDTSAKRAQFDMDVVEFEPSGRPGGESGPIERTFNFTALGTSGEDELTETYA